MSKPIIRNSLIVGSTFGAAVFVVAFIGGAGITAAFGPGTSGIITALFTTTLVVLSCLFAPRFPTLLTANLVFALLAIPTTLFGPFGAAKLLFGLSTGLIYEACRWKLFPNRPNLGLMIGAALSAFASVYLIFYGTSILGGSPSATLAKYLHYFAAIYSLLGVGGAWLAIKLNEKLKNHPTVKRLQSESAQNE